MGSESWKFTQWFKKQDPQFTPEENLMMFGISSLRFHPSGDYLATGDNSGQIVVLRHNEAVAQEKKEPVRFTLHVEIDAFPPEFDYVASKTVPERVTDIQWGPNTQDSIYLLASNAKHVKLFKINETKPIMRIVNLNDTLLETNPLLSMRFSNNSLLESNFTPLVRNSIKDFRLNLKVPKVIRDPLSVVWREKYNYKPSNDFYEFNPTLNMSVTSDKENFLAASCYSVKLCDFHTTDHCQEILSLPYGGNKPGHKEEIITSLECHPLYSHIFLYGTTLGNLKLCDLRQKSHANSASKLYKNVKLKPEEKDQQSFLDEVTSGITSAKFSHGGRFFVTRDYMSVKIWDVNYEKRPWETIYVHEFLRDNLFSLHQSKAVWDPFDLDINQKGHIVTGSYSNFFHMFDLQKKEDTFIQASQGKDQTVTPLKQHTKRKPPKVQSTKKKDEKKSVIRRMFSRKKAKKKEVSSEASEPEFGPAFHDVDFAQKISLCNYHPEKEAVAIAGQSSLYVYAKVKNEHHL